MHGFILSAAVAGEGFRETLQDFRCVSHLSRAAKKQEREEEGETGAETQGTPSMREAAKLSREASA
jgi:hypothetical protein